jgi:hypothetical protein
MCHGRGGQAELGILLGRRLVSACESRDHCTRPTRDLLARQGIAEHAILGGRIQFFKVTESSETRGKSYLDRQ